MTLVMATLASNKRKLPFQGTPGSTNPTGARKRTRTHDARALAVQSTEAALSSTGELDVAAFIGAREYEIRALEDGMQRSKSAHSTRAFQKVPRALRRRTASHNVKRVPQRLRARAKREMKEDNTPTVTARRKKPTRLLRIRLETARRLQALNAKTKAKRAAFKAKRDKEQREQLETENSHAFEIAPRVPKIKKGKLSRPNPPEAKFQKRQRDKTWLPTHMFHTKRAHMTPLKEPLWRFALPLCPTEKSYRPTHRSAEERGAVAWDMSYISTIQLEGTAESLEAVLKAVGIDGENAWGKKGRRWRQGTRSLQAWTFAVSDNNEPIAPVTIVWRAKAQEKDVGTGNIASESSGQDKNEKTGSESRGGRWQKRERIFVRVHPSAFLQLWNDLLSVSKKQRPPVLLEDLRFDIGSIEVIGPSSTEALVAAMKPIFSTEKTSSPGSPENLWPSLSGVTNPSSLPSNALLAFSISDPRLQYPLQPLRPSLSGCEADNLAQMLSSWPIDHTQTAPSLFDRSARLAATQRLPSQKAINRRRTLAGPGNHPSPQPSDPQIPVLALASRSRMNSQGRWTVLLPWKCVVPLWYMIMYYPMSSGGIPRFGGVEQQQQLDFERGAPWFPGDFPGTRAGWQWGIRERQKSEREWKRKPKGRRIEFASVDLGNGCVGEIGCGWACDWERLVEGPKKLEQGRDDENDLEMQEKDQGDEESKAQQKASPPLNIRQLSPNTAESLMARASILPPKMRTLFDTPYLMTVRITLLNRGTPTPHARIYRLPNNDNALREKWISLASELGHFKPTKNEQKISTKKEPKSSKGKLMNEDQTRSEQVEARKQLATSLLSTPPPEDIPSSDIHLPTPHEQELIGFVTSGNYNLAEGKGTGIGSVLVSKVIHFEDDTPQEKRPKPVDGTRSGKGSAFKPRRPHNDAARLCIIRSAGERIGRLGFWEVA